MKNKLIYILILIFSLQILCSCSNDEHNDEAVTYYFDDGYMLINEMRDGYAIPLTLGTIVDSDNDEKDMTGVTGWELGYCFVNNVGFNDKEVWNDTGIYTEEEVFGYLDRYFTEYRQTLIDHFTESQFWIGQRLYNSWEGRVVTIEEPLYDTVHKTFDFRPLFNHLDMPTVEQVHVRQVCIDAESAVILFDAKEYEYNSANILPVSFMLTLKKDGDRYIFLRYEQVDGSEVKNTLEKGNVWVTSTLGVIPETEYLAEHIGNAPEYRISTEEYLYAVLKSYQRAGLLERGEKDLKNITRRDIEAFYYFNSREKEEIETRVEIVQYICDKHFSDTLGYSRLINFRNEDYDPNEKTLDMSFTKDVTVQYDGKLEIKGYEISADGVKVDYTVSDSRGFKKKDGTIWLGYNGYNLSFQRVENK